MGKDIKPDDFDSEGFKACKKCKSRNLLVSGHFLDAIYITCLDCGFNVGPGEPYYVLGEWNKNDPQDNSN